MGQKVWVMRPKPLGGHKIQPWWAGPYPIIAQEGAQSFVVQWGDSGGLRVHADQLKPWFEDVISTPSIPIHYHQGEGVAQGPLEVGQVKGHRNTAWGWEFLTHWKGAPVSEDTWEPISTFIQVQSPEWQAYCAQQGLAVALNAAVPSSR